MGRPTRPRQPGCLFRASEPSALNPRPHPTDIAIIDSPGHNDGAATATARHSNLVLIPSRPNVFDLETLAAVRDLLRVAGDPPAFVLLNGVHPAATHAAEEAKTGLKDSQGRPLGLKACPVHLSYRDIFDNAPTTGNRRSKSSRKEPPLPIGNVNMLNMLGGQHGEGEPSRPAKGA